jgi:gluconokinase
VGDGAASNVGAGAVGEREIAVTVGTSAAIRAVRPGPPRVTPNLWTYRIDRDRPVMGGALSEGGDVYEWLVATMRLSRHAQDRAARLTPDGHGLTVLPLLGGERSPGWSLDARGVLAGLSLATKPEEILLATFESVAYRLAALHDILVAQLPSLPRIVATGGALLSSPLWCRIIADVLGRPLGVSAEPESSCRGVALLALEREGAIAALDAEPAALATTLEPDPARHLAYVAARARQDDLYARLFGAGS